MKNLIILVLWLSFGVAGAQIRAFDNSKALLPWIYNPSADFTDGFQAYAAYDGRGNGNVMPQSVVAGLRLPVNKGRKNLRRGPKTMMGIQVLKTSQDMLSASTITATFAHQIPVTTKVRLAFGLGAGIFEMKYNYDALDYIDQQDPLLNNGVNFFNFHLNAGFSLLVEDKVIITLAAPALIKDHRANPQEIIFRTSYVVALNQEVNLITSANLDTYNRSLIFGGDLQMEWRKMVSAFAGADRYKFYGGASLQIKPFSVGYCYGMNYSHLMDYVPAHQISVSSSLPSRR